MAIGYICPCCGEKVSREVFLGGGGEGGAGAEGSGNNNVFVCQPCGSNPTKGPQPPDMSVHTLPNDTPVVVLDATSAFNLLSEKEKSYAYHLGKADWEGAKINFLQCSVESVPIFALLQLCYSAQPIEDLKKKAAEAGLSSDDIDAALLYSAAFLGNMGNYKSFGDTKFIPGLPAENFFKFLLCSDAQHTTIDKLWNECYDRMYCLVPRQRQMGLGASKGITNYFTANCDESDAIIANAFLASIGLAADNTRLFKTGDKTYEVRLASSITADYNLREKTQYEYEGATFQITLGDYGPLMGRVTSALKDAIPHTANDQQTQMLEKYIESFDTGDHDAHKDASRFWIQDKGPAVESYIGFIESYRDPSGVRGEWEGFVACVNKEVSRKFQILVDSAESFLEKMPWPKEFEKDVFLRPDFTSLEVLSFGSSGVPAGINIPNYDEIRQSEGFKNVSLGNVLQASYSVAPDKKVSFVATDDQSLYKALKGHAFEVQVGIHELLGHGSGKLYHQGTPDAENLKGTTHPVTGEPIVGPFYASGATWNSTFGKISPTYEECRAECSGLFLCLESEILKVFGVEEGDDSKMVGGIHDVSYINWLLMARAGLTGLEFYTPSTHEWRQAHMQARYVILRLLLEAGDGNLLTLKEFVGEDGKPDVEVSLDRALISTVGRKAVGDFLLKLQVYKSLGDVDTGSKFYSEYSHVPEDMAKLRTIVMTRKEPRKLLIQPHMYKDDDGKIKLKTFPATVEGMIKSFTTRYPSEDSELLALYDADKEAMTD